jgi:hypothetical protein
MIRARKNTSALRCALRKSQTENPPSSPMRRVPAFDAAGDSGPVDGAIEIFQNLFPSNHPKYAFMSRHWSISRFRIRKVRGEQTK